MESKFFLTLIMLSGLLLSAQQDNDKPNLIVIMTDDMGYADVGFNGCKDIPTPNIDSIAYNGAHIVNGYVSFPVCGPSRAGFITGRYQDRFGFTTNPTIDPTNDIAGLPLDEKTIAEVLHEEGYKSAIVGKWHLGTHPNFHPLKRGFDYFYGFLSGGHNYFMNQLTVENLENVKSKWAWYKTKLRENHKTLEFEDYKTDYLTDELSEAGLRFINKQAENDQSFFLFLAYNAPHTPMHATEKYLSRFPHIKDTKRKTYAAMVSAVDDGIGLVLEALKENGQIENTIIVFLSDNGGAHNNASQNTPLRGTKGSVYEGGFRVPFAMQWKGVIPANTRYEESVSSLDIMASIVDILDIKTNPKKPLDGVNIIPYLTGKKKGAPHEYLFWRKWEQNAMAAINTDYKLLKVKKNAETEFYNLKKDVSEKENIKGSSSKKVQEIQKEWDKWNAQLKDRVFPTLGNDKWWLRIQNKSHD
ncbi:MAG: sulfatase-like hydrolase/transferase [Flavobacteriaceae bacterium]|nr:sulfatase-like hydrolase/transferase [Flavobacteriaceae bacterium]